MNANTETHTATTLTDPNPKRKPGRPKGSKDKKPRKNARRAEQRPARARPGLWKAQNPTKGQQVNARWPDEALARLDAYTAAHAHDGRAEAMREAALSWIGRWEHLSRQEPPQEPAPLPLWARVRLVWGVLLGKYSAAQRGAEWVLQRASNTD